ncbi:MAG: ribonuclease D [Brucellaceae bacterium]|nr:ribonuclease D [Brucellaceae bacterium]
MQLIKTTKDLDDIVRILSKSDFVTVDTEFIRETTFWPELCLIQMATRDATALVDPLADGIDLAPFFRLMADTSTVKVFHAARQDIEIVYKLGGLIPTPLFDTQVAAMVCGFGDSISYDQLVGKVTGAHIDKSSRFTDWRRRPLSDKQLAYALADVTHLIDVYEHLKAELAREGRAEWVAEEMAVLENPQTYDLHPDEAWTRLKLRARKPVELALTQKIAAWRERQARERNVPRSRVMKDDAIYEIAQQQPRSEKALGHLRTTTRGWERSPAGQDILALVAEAVAIPSEDLPRLPRRKSSPEGANAAVELLKVLLKLVSEEHGVAPKVLASGDDLEKLAQDGEEADVVALHGWRRAVFGEPALKLVRGELAIRFANRKLEVFSVKE